MPNSGGLVSKNKMNTTFGHVRRDYSTFDDSLSYSLLNTHRFGDYTPSFDMEGVERDDIYLNTKDLVDSLSLKAPFKTQIRKIKESFNVPFMAILPQNWDQIYVQPSNGDDVPQGANCVLPDFPSSFKSLWTTLFANLVNTTSVPVTNQAQLNTFFTYFFRLLVLGEFVYSTGSLLNVSGYKHSGLWRYLKYDRQRTNDLQYWTYDQWFDANISLFCEDIASFTVREPVGSGTRTYYFRGLSSTTPDSSGRMSFRALLELFRDNPMCYVYDAAVGADTTLSQVIQDINADRDQNTVYGTFISNNILIRDVTASGDVSDETSLSQTVLNISRLLAYQLVCSHYFTNSSIDFVYSAELYRQYIDVLYRTCVPSNLSTVFTWNGLTRHYDYLSGALLIRLLALNNTTTRSNLIGAFGYDVSSFLTPLAAWAAIFGFNKSLRYGDYFTGSRPRPLAPINTDVAVSNNTVSVIDITRRIQAQRFGNAVMRFRSKIDEYVEGLTGKRPAPDYHNPFWLAREVETIFGDEVQNTGSAQITDGNSRTANFASNLGRYTFKFENDDAHPSIYLQIVYYDAKVAYSRSSDRQFFHADRFDMFNPEFQFIGDQPIYGLEIGYGNALQAVPSVFAYTTRDMEYKQRFDVCSGGFSSGALRSWAFTDDILGDYGFTNISPEFIRSRNVDLDRFFVSLTGYSLGTYFHFIVKTINNVRAKRIMAVDPQILE